MKRIGVFFAFFLVLNTLNLIAQGQVNDCNAKAKIREITRLLDSKPIGHGPWTAEETFCHLRGTYDISTSIWIEAVVNNNPTSFNVAEDNALQNALQRYIVQTSAEFKGSGKGSTMLKILEMLKEIGVEIPSEQFYNDWFNTYKGKMKPDDFKFYYIRATKSHNVYLMGVSDRKSTKDKMIQALEEVFMKNKVVEEQQKGIMDRVNKAFDEMKLPDEINNK